jgi:DNA-directed RNA polymerase subunit RPC12/RpoP
MSYVQFQQHCTDCKKTWTAAFGIVGTTQIAAPPIKCPECGSSNIAETNIPDFCSAQNVTVYPPAVTLEKIKEVAERISVLQHMGFERNLALRTHRIEAILREEFLGRVGALAEITE